MAPEQNPRRPGFHFAILLQKCPSDRVRGWRLSRNYGRYSRISNTSDYQNIYIFPSRFMKFGRNSARCMRSPSRFGWPAVLLSRLSRLLFIPPNGCVWVYYIIYSYDYSRNGCVCLLHYLSIPMTIPFFFLINSPNSRDTSSVTGYSLCWSQDPTRVRVQRRPAKPAAPRIKKSQKKQKKHKKKKAE